MHPIIGVTEKLGKSASERLKLLRDLSISLILHERVVTTSYKARALQPVFDRLINIMKPKFTQDSLTHDVWQRHFERYWRARYPDILDIVKHSRSLNFNKLRVSPGGLINDIGDGHTKVINPECLIEPFDINGELIYGQLPCLKDLTHVAEFITPEHARQKLYNELYARYLFTSGSYTTVTPLGRRDDWAEEYNENKGPRGKGKHKKKLRKPHEPFQYGHFGDNAPLVYVELVGAPFNFQKALQLFREQKVLDQEQGKYLDVGPFEITFKTNDATGAKIEGSSSADTVEEPLKDKSKDFQLKTDAFYRSNEYHCDLEKARNEYQANIDLILKEKLMHDLKSKSRININNQSLNYLKSLRRSL